MSAAYDTDTPVFLSADWTDADQRAWAADVADLATRFKRDADVRDWKHADRRYQERVEAGETLDEYELADFHWCIQCIIAADLAERGL
jgi:hypothetical protein